MSSHILSSAVLLSISIGLAACGGGGGSGGGSAPETGNSAPVSLPPVAQVQPAAIVTQPASQSAAIGASVTFTVEASGPDLLYQWRSDGRAIPGATGASYTLSGVQAADDGAVFTVEVRNGAGSVVSAGAALQVAVPKGLSLLAGRLGGLGNLDGKDGRLFHPVAVGVAPSGQVYVSDATSWNYGPGTLRTVDPATGAIATVQSYTEETFPIALRFDAAGNRLELTRSGIFKTTPAGVRSLLAGSGASNSGIAGPIRGAAAFGTAADMVIDDAGNLYVADVSDRTIRKVDPAGRVVTLAGSGGDRVTDGSGARASFQYPSRLAVDRAGNVFVVDRGANGAATFLRKVTPDGTVTTLALKEADGAAAVTDLGGYAGALAFDAAGNLYVTDASRGCRVRRIGQDGTVTDVAGSLEAIGNANGKGGAARFCGTIGLRMENLAADRAGNLIVLDGDNSTVRRVTPEGEVTTVAGRAGSVANLDGKGPAAAFLFARVPNPSPLDFYVRSYSLASDAQGTLYVGEGDRLRKVGAAGVVSTLPMASEVARDARYYPGGLAYGRGAIVVSNNVVHRLDADGTLHFVAGQPAAPHSRTDGTGANADFANPYDLVMDGLGNIVLHDADDTGGSPYERRIAPDGTVGPLAPSKAYNPALAWHADKDGNLLLAHRDGAVSLVDPKGVRTTLRAPSRALDEQPTAITRDAAGNVYLAALRIPDGGGAWYLVRRIAPDGSETVVAGTEGNIGVRLGYPGSLGRVDAMAPGPDGVLYLMTENAVLKLKP